MNRFFLFCVVVACFLQGCKQNSLAENNGGTDDTDSIGMVDDDPTADETDELISEEPMPKAAEEFFDDFFFNLYINDDYLLSSFCKLKYLENKNDEQLNIALDISKEEIKFIDTKIKTFIYEKAKSNLLALEESGNMVQDENPCLYIYRQVMNGRAQTGIVGCASIDDYKNNIIKKHEYTLAKKEQDRINHVNICDANTGPIFLTYRNSNEINDTLFASTRRNIYCYVY